VEHLVHINWGAGPKVLCESCRGDHKARAIFMWILTIGILVWIVIMVISFGHR
jgi:hypothetical protein